MALTIVLWSENIVPLMRTTLQEARKRKHLTPETLAERSGVSRATIYRLEAGANPSYGTAIKLEDALGLKRGALMFGAELAAAS